ncbi:MAG TPA: hypothetical protein VGN90_01980 [Pyrinomonadaceae bacterium]|jgi:hypothetical protein|nr:hypothetical protein [Pyrinomonadaceae bacterium]
MITKLEILDTAVKVGLGAAISVLGSYLVAKLTHDRTTAKERAERRRALLETVAEQVSTFSQASLKHWGLVVNWIQYPSTSEFTQEMRLNLAARLAEFMEGFKEVSSAESKLALLGELDCESLLRDYSNSSIPFREEVVANRDLTVKELDDYHDLLGKKHDAFFAELSKVYKKY